MKHHRVSTCWRFIPICAVEQFGFIIVQVFLSQTEHTSTPTQHYIHFYYIQEAQLPQRNSASATHDYLGWSADLLDDHTWQFNAQNTAESQRLCYF